MKSTLYQFALPVAFSFMPLQAEVPQRETSMPAPTERVLPSDREDGFTDVIVLQPRGIKNVDMIEKAQQKIIDKSYPNYRAVLSIYMKDKKNRYIEIVSCMNNENETIRIYFDMSEVYEKLKTKDKETKEKIEELEKLYINLK